MKKKVLFINGVADDKKIKIRKVHRNGRMQWIGTGSSNLRAFLKNDLFDQVDFLFDTRMDQMIPRQMIHAVFNEISDADTHKIALKKADDFYKAVSPHIPFFNAPLNVMKTTRDNIYRSLQGIDKLHVPKTVKFQPKSPSDIYDTIKKEGFKYPVIFRQAGDHGGISTIRLEDDTEEFYIFALDGRDYYLTQYVEYMKDGMYTKYRLVVVGGEVFIRHAFFGKEWMMHGRNQLEKEESNIYKQPVAERFINEIKPLIQPMIAEIHQRVGLDYFGIDCHIDDDMNILLFELNANMQIFGTKNAKNNVFKDHIRMARRALIEMISSKIKEY